MLREISYYTEAYLYYLCTTYLPLALDRDPTFGLRRTELVSALSERGAACDDAAVRRTCLSLAGQVKETR